MRFRQRFRLGNCKMLAQHCCAHHNCLTSCMRAAVGFIGATTGYHKVNVMLAHAGIKTSRAVDQKA